MAPNATRYIVLTKEDILRAQDLSKPLEAFDARCAAFVGSNEFIITTPREIEIYVPPVGEQEVSLRVDYRFGPHDHTLYPQPYLEELPHWAAIPKRPIHLSDPLSVMWWDPTERDFVASTGNLVSGLGKLSKERYEPLENMEKSLSAKLEKYKDSVAAPNRYLILLERALVSARARLGHLQTTYTQMRFGITDFQRLFLETRGLLDYLLIYKPRMDGVAPPATESVRTIGAFTNVAQIAQDLFIAGLPCWFIRPAESFRTSPPNVLRFTEATPPCAPIRFQFHDPPFPVIYKGLTTDDEKHHAVWGYTRNWLKYKDPFDEPPVRTSKSQLSSNQPRSSSPPQSVQEMPRQSGSSSKAGDSRHDRNKYEPLNSPFAPFSIPAWSEALQQVNRDPSNLVNATKKLEHFGHYAFPDPGLLVTPTNDLRKARFIESWLRVRAIWILRVKSESSLAMSNQSWRDLLATNLSKPTTQTKKRAQHQPQKVLDAILATADSALKRRDCWGEPIWWGDKEFVPQQIPPANIMRQVLWELYELNFAYELLALDRRACAVSSADPYDTENHVLPCFVHCPAFLSVIPSFNCGLAEDDINARLRFILALARLMARWHGCPLNISAWSKKSVSELSELSALELEKAVAKYYTQTFFNYFGRAAQIPHRIYPVKKN